MDLYIQVHEQHSLCAIGERDYARTTGEKGEGETTGGGGGEKGKKAGEEEVRYLVSGF